MLYHNGAGHVINGQRFERVFQVAHASGWPLSHSPVAAKHDDLSLIWSYNSFGSSASSSVVLAEEEKHHAQIANNS